MSIIEKPLATDPQQETGREAVPRPDFHGEPLDPEVARRLQERAATITEEIRRTRGVLDDETFGTLLDDES